MLHALLRPLLHVERNLCIRDMSLQKTAKDVRRRKIKQTHALLLLYHPIEERAICYLRGVLKELKRERVSLDSRERRRSEKKLAI